MKKKNGPKVKKNQLKKWNNLYLDQMKNLKHFVHNSKIKKENLANLFNLSDQYLYYYNNNN